MEATRRALPKGPAGRARHGKRLPQVGTSSGPTVIIGLPVSNPGFTDTGPGSAGTGVGTNAGLGAGTGAGTDGSTGIASDDPNVGDTGDVRTVTVVKAGTQVLTTIGISTPGVVAATSSPLAQSVSSSGPLVSSSSSSTSSTSTPNTTSNTSSGSSATSSAVQTSSASASSTTQQSQQDASASDASGVSKSVSPAAIAGILIFVSIAVIAALIWFIRKKMMAKRQQKRATRTWTAHMFVKGSEVADPEAALGANNYTSNAYAGSYLSEKPSTPPAIVTDFGSTIPSTLRPGQGRGSPVSAGPSPAGRTIAPNLSLTPPMSQYNAGGAAYMSPSLVIPPATFVASGGGDNRTALVRCTYIPRLPDELSITTGQMITVNNTYDDGWALCTNDRGDQGVVPLDCLNAVENSAAQSGDRVGAAQVQRASSLRRF